MKKIKKTPYCFECLRSFIRGIATTIFKDIKVSKKKCKRCKKKPLPRHHKLNTKIQDDKPFRKKSKDKKK